MSAEDSGEVTSIEEETHNEYLLRNLSPNTVYTVLVDCRPGVGGYWSDLRSVNILTNKDGKAIYNKITAIFLILLTLHSRQ